MQERVTNVEAKTEENKIEIRNLNRLLAYSLLITICRFIHYSSNFLQFQTNSPSNTTFTLVKKGHNGKILSLGFHFSQIQ